MPHAGYPNVDSLSHVLQIRHRVNEILTNHRIEPAIDPRQVGYPHFLLSEIFASPTPYRESTKGDFDSGPRVFCFAAATMAPRPPAWPLRTAMIPRHDSNICHQLFTDGLPHRGPIPP